MSFFFGLFPLTVSFQAISQVTVPCLEMPGWKEMLEALLNDPLSLYMQNHSLLFPALFIPMLIHMPALSTAPFVICSPLGDLAVFDIQKFLTQAVILSPHSSVSPLILAEP